MPGYANFEVERNKRTTGFKDIYNTPKKTSKTTENLSKNIKLRNGFKKWTSFYRGNPHRFIIDYIGVQLHLFQQILIYLAFHSDFFMYLAARGQGKSFLVALIACVYAILWPGSNIVIASGTRGQSRLIISKKIEEELRRNYPNLAREIKDVRLSGQECTVIFQNGSVIQSVTSADSSRGFRANILICDEFRLIKKEILDKVLRHFLTVNRFAPYMMKKEYRHLQEENKEIYISSAYYKTHWMYSKFLTFVDMMAKGERYFVCGLPWQLSVEHGILSKKRVEQMKQEEDYSEIDWHMEMDCLFFGENEKAFFKLKDIQNCRTLVKPFYPMSDIDALNKKSEQKSRKNLPKREDEIRIIGVDVAFMEGERGQNDSTVFTCMRILPNRDSFTRQVPYVESCYGLHSQVQAIKLKRLFYDFEADYVVMDTGGSGLSLFDDCARVLYDEERDVEYPAWTAMNKEEMKSRALDKNALPIVYSLKVTRPELNHDIAMNLRTAFQRGIIRLLVSDVEARDYLIEKFNYLNKSIEEQVEMMRSFTQTSMLVAELVNLEGEVKGGYVRLVKSRKLNSSRDRYSSLAYANYYAKILEEGIRKNRQKDQDIKKYMLIKAPKIRRVG